MNHAKLIRLFIFIPLIFLTSFLMFSQETQFLVEDVEGEIIKINAGSRQGVKTDYTGRTFKETQVEGKIIPIYTSRFEITLIETNTSQARIITQSPTDPPVQGQKVVFDQELIPQGTLAIRSRQPNAEVRIDGNYRGEAPLDLFLDPGTYSLLIQKNGYRDYTDRVTMNSGQETRIDYPLIPIPPQTYRLRVNTVPEYASVYIGGVEKGRTPLDIEFQRTGAVEIRIEKEDYETIESTINISQSVTERIYTLERNRFNLKISTSPAGARVLIDDSDMGITTLETVVEKGIHKLRLEKEGYYPKEEYFEIESDIERTIELDEIASGYLVISCYPYANVEIYQGEVMLEETSGREVPPVFRVKLPVGKYKIRFIASRLNKESIIEVELNKGEEKRVHEIFK